MKPLFLFTVCYLFLLAPVNAAEGTTRSESETQQQELIDYYFAAARTNETDVLETFLAHDFPVDLVNTQSYTALMMAAYYGNLEAVEVLLAHGANACLEDKRGNTAFMGALVKAEFSVAKRLYAEKCDLHHTNKAGLSIEEFAQMFGQDDTLELLRQQQQSE